MTERPSTIFKRHVRVVPYPEDDTPLLVDRLGTVDCLVMGSDWPHAEGLREPAEMFHRVAALDDDTRRKFLRDNGMALVS